MRYVVWLLSALLFIPYVQANAVSEEKPIQHLNVPDITSLEEAKKLFVEKTLEMKSKQVLDVEALQQIHLITYSLEKSVAYFSKTLSGNERLLINDIAQIVEAIHLHSEHNRPVETENQLTHYFNLASRFIYEHWTL